MERRYFNLLTLSILLALMALQLRGGRVLRTTQQNLRVYERLKPGSYAAKVYDLQQVQQAKATQFLEKVALAEQYALVENVPTSLTERIEKELFPHWYETPYDFYGMTETPGKGQIACGYFVTTVLRDAGVPIERIKMAQAASEQMIKALVDERYIKRFSRVPIRDFIYAIEDMGEGLYVVGLDTHTGFLTYDGLTVRFIHATARQGLRKVVNEDALTSASLIRSKYRVVGKLTGDEDLMKRWLLRASPTS